MDERRQADSAPVIIRPARAAEVSCLAAIELAAARSLAPYAPRTVLEETTEPGDFIDALDNGRLWVADAEGIPVGFALVELLEDSHPHLEEIDVHPAFQRRGVGRALIRAVLAWLAASEWNCMTLTTFRTVPWNAPFYAAMGFRELAQGEYPDSLLAVITEEALRGLDPASRVAMLIEI